MSRSTRPSESATCEDRGIRRVLTITSISPYAGKSLGYAIQCLVELFKKGDEITGKLADVSIPFDKLLAPESNVHT